MAEPDDEDSLACWFANGGTYGEWVINQTIAGGGGISDNVNVTNTCLNVQGCETPEFAVLVEADSLPLPTGAATSALQTTGNTTLTSISGQLPATLGAKTTANSLAVNIASDQTVPVSAASLPLPSLAATSTKQSDGTQKTQVVDGSGNVIGSTANALNVNIASGSSSSAITSVIPGTGATNLGKAEDAAHTSGDVGVFMLGVRNDTLSSLTGADGRYGGVAIDKANRIVTMPYSAVEARTSGVATTTGTSTTSLIAAHASLRIYVTALQVTNTGATTAGITIQDGSGGATIGVAIAPAGGGDNIVFPSPIRTTAATALFFQAGAASTTISIAAQGYNAP